MHSVVMPTWDTGSRAVLRPAIGLDVLARLTQNLGSLGGMVTGSIVVGHAANLEMPSLTETSPALPLPVPMMQILAQCEYTPPELPPAPAILTPAALANFPIIGHIQLTEVRTLQDTISVTSGMETVLTAVSGPTAFSFDIVFPAAFPTMIRLVPDGGPAIDLVNGTQDHIPVGPTGTFTLSFAPEVPEMGSNIQSDYYEVVLHKVGRAALTTQRIYTVTVPSVRIDPSVLAPATEYVFEVRSYKGRPMAARGDFIPVDYPYGAAIVFTHSFKTS
jgi:hypothetical protein